VPSTAPLLSSFDFYLLNPSPLLINAPTDRRGGDLEEVHQLRREGLNERLAMRQRLEEARLAAEQLRNQIAAEK
jgi:hypothetical protein